MKKLTLLMNGKPSKQCFDDAGIPAKDKVNKHPYGDDYAMSLCKFCFECYDEHSKEFVKILNKFKKIQKKYKNKKHPSKKLKKLDDFRISKTGFLIHEECFDKDENGIPRFKFDVEKAIVDAFVTGFSGLIDFEKRMIEEFQEEEPSMIIKSHVPALVHLLSKSNWRTENSVEATYVRENGDIYNEVHTDPCKTFKNKISTEAASNECKYIKKVQAGRPKIFCDLSEDDKIIRENHPSNFEGLRANATNPNNPSPTVKVRNGITKIYGSPSIMFNPVENSDWTSERFQSTLFHETFHNLGYRDDSDGHNSYSYMCQAALFHKKTHSDVISEDLYGNAALGCLSSSYSDAKISTASDIQRAVGDDND